jgi:hypothetical protein
MTEGKQNIRIYRGRKGWSIAKKDPYNFWQGTTIHGLWISKGATDIAYFRFNERHGHQNLYGSLFTRFMGTSVGVSYKKY